MHQHKLSAARAGLELTLAALFWGFGFIAARWALEALSPSWLSGVRFLSAFLLSLPLIIFLAKKNELLKVKSSLLLSFMPGVFLTLTIVFQTWGLKYTTATNASFITSLYVVFVPIMERFLFKKKLEFTHSVLVIIAIIGTGLICDLQHSTFNWGDLLTVFCSLAGAAHIVNISYVSGKIDSPFFFNSFQCFWSGGICILLAMGSEPFVMGPMSVKPIIGFCLLLFGSTLFGFMIQIRAQRVLSSNAASLICLLESPFGAFFAYVFLAERLQWSQWAGAILIFFSAIYTILLENRKNKSTPTIAKT